ncbi:hypothetical protein FDUTEX481_10130 [Tolypothrix sp. PCC 7601]|nr:hypothetical protein FDUTEX481_10130 [Tolypothrix sp. PCC 7601]
MIHCNFNLSNLLITDYIKSKPKLATLIFHYIIFNYSLIN